MPAPATEDAGPPGGRAEAAGRSIGEVVGPRRGSVAVPLAVAALVAAGWALTVRLSAAGHHATHGAGLAALCAMWAAMAVGMMVPIEAASLVRLARGIRDASSFLAGYLLPWLAFSVGAAALQRELHPEVASTRWIGAGVLLAAALLQLSPLRRACLDRCRAASRNASGTGGFGGGIGASLWSIGCCGLLMLVPVATGAMSVSWMAALTVLLVVEREVAGSGRFGALAGAALIVLSASKALA
jgi:predicted metal-binding membrane protein